MVAHAQRSSYTALLEAGVSVWLEPEPYVLHSKFFTVDEDLAVIGSSHTDYRGVTRPGLGVRQILTGADE